MSTGTTKFLTSFARTDEREEYEWYGNWVTGQYDRYRVVTTEVWEALLDDGEPKPASFVNPGRKAVGVWKCESRGVSDPFGTPLRRMYHETWVMRSALIYV